MRIYPAPVHAHTHTQTQKGVDRWRIAKTGDPVCPQGDKEIEIDREIFLAQYIRPWFKYGFGIYFSLQSGSASFLCAVLMSPQRTKQFCPQIG